MTKKIICAFLITATMLSFAACGNDSKGNEEEKKEEVKVSEKATDEEAKEEETEADEKTEDSTDIALDFSAEDFENMITIEENTEDRVYVEDMKGKTFAEVLDAGYDYMGYGGWGDEYTFMLTSENIDPEIENTLKKLEGKTVKELADKDISIGYYAFGDSDYTYTARIGGVDVEFDIEGSSEIVKKNKEEDSFADIEDMEELYDIKISNVEISNVSYTLKFDDSFDASKFKNGDDFELENPEEQLKDFVVEEFYYDSIPADFKI